MRAAAIRAGTTHGGNSDAGSGDTNGEPHRATGIGLLERPQPAAAVPPDQSLRRRRRLGVARSGCPGSASVVRVARRIEPLQGDWRPAPDQLSRHADGHRRLGGVARSAGSQDGGQPAVRPARRADGGRRRAPGAADRRRMGHGQRRMRGGDVARNRGVRRRRQSRSARPHPEPHRLREGRSHHPHPFAQRLRRGDPRRRGQDRRGRHAGRAASWRSVRRRR